MREENMKMRPRPEDQLAESLGLHRREREGRARRGEASVREGQIGRPMPELGDWLGPLEGA